MKLTKPLSILIIKRFMMEEPASKKRIKSTSEIPLIEPEPAFIEPEPILEPALEPMLESERKLATAERIRKLLKEHEEIKKTSNDQRSRLLKGEPLQNDDNSSFTTEVLSEPKPFYTAPVLNKEILLTDAAVRTAVTKMDDIARAAGIEIKKSDELATEWQKDLKGLRALIDACGKFPWKRTLKWSACLLTIGAFLWKIGAARALPNFLSTAISLVPNPMELNVGRHAANVAQHSSVIPPSDLLHMPLTPMGLITGAGMLSIGFVILHIVHKVVTKLPK